MADLILHKRSSTASAVPSAGSIALGELAINTADGRLFLKKGDGTVVDVTSIGGIQGLTEALAGKMTNPMTTAGDMIRGGTSGAPERVAAGTNGYVWTMVAGVPVWALPGSADVDFTIIYPNGGSAASPANVDINSRYVEANPFPGHRVVCVAEIQLGGQWGVSGDISGGSSVTNYGVAAHQLNDGSIVVQTRSTGITSTSSASLSPFGWTGGNVTSPTPCRVKVWKVKGAIA